MKSPSSSHSICLVSSSTSTGCWKFTSLTTHSLYYYHAKKVNPSCLILQPRCDEDNQSVHLSLLMVRNCSGSFITLPWWEEHPDSHVHCQKHRTECSVVKSLCLELQNFAQKWIYCNHLDILCMLTIPLLNSNEIFKTMYFTLITNNLSY